ncbi:MAG: hypothetical protein QNJ09_14335 [Paracoccaceae bacterium]|nr:hypothetical protein [Paracoccaceae bacterium]
MCLPLQTLIVFLNLIGPDMVTSEPGRFIVHAQTGDTHWVETQDNWCTMGPQLDRMAR